MAWYGMDIPWTGLYWTGLGCMYGSGSGSLTGRETDRENETRIEV